MAELQPTHADLRRDMDLQHVVMQRVEKKLDDLIKTVGFHGHDEHGQLIGTGLAGDLARLRAKVDQRFSLYDGVTKYVAGALAAASVLVAAIWWLVSDKVSGVLK